MYAMRSRDSLLDIGRAGDHGLWRRRRVGRYFEIEQTVWSMSWWHAAILNLDVSSVVVPSSRGGTRKANWFICLPLIGLSIESCTIYALPARLYLLLLGSIGTDSALTFDREKGAIGVFSLHLVHPSLSSCTGLWGSPYYWGTPTTGGLPKPLSGGPFNNQVRVSVGTQVGAVCSAGRLSGRTRAWERSSLVGLVQCGAAAMRRPCSQLIYWQFLCVKFPVGYLYFIPHT